MEKYSVSYFKTTNIFGENMGGGRGVEGAFVRVILLTPWLIAIKSRKKIRLRDTYTVILLRI